MNGYNNNNNNNNNDNNNKNSNKASSENAIADLPQTPHGRMPRAYT